MKEFKNHTFVVCAYKESEYLEECIKSVLNQNVKSNVIMATSTPNKHIEMLAQKYNIPLFINEGKSGIGTDWNFGISKVNTDYATVAHQDDIYNENYLEEVFKLYEKNPNFSIAFGDYREIKNGEIIPLTINLKIKKLLLKKLLKNPNSKKAKDSALKFGCSICCPCVTVNLKVAGKQPYKTKMKCDLDWDTWYELSKLENDFAYINKEIMCHRIHEASETSNLIENNIRLEEDLVMLEKYWPKPVAKIIMRFYGQAVKTNEM